MPSDEKTYILQEKAANRPAEGGSGAHSAVGVEEDDLVKKGEEPDEKAASLSTTAFNYINSIIGSGIIAMPFAFRQAGVGLGTLILIFIAVITDYSLILMVRGGQLSGTTSYQAMVKEAFGKPGYVLISAIQFVYPFFTMVSYNVIVGDTVTKVVIRVLMGSQGSNLASTSPFLSREFVSLVTTLLVTLPLSLYRDIGKLAKSSMVSMIFIVFILASVFISMHKFDGLIPASEDAWEFVNFSGALKAISITTFAFMCHHNTFLLYCSIDNKSLAKWNKVTHASIMISFITMILMAFAGYATFTGHVQGDLLNNYCWSDDLMNVSRLFFSITILLTYPIECFVCREVVQNVLGFEQENLGKFWHSGITIAIVVATYLLSLITDCLASVLEINGLVAAIPLAFIMPALCYIRLEEGPVMTAKKGPAFFLAFFGIFVTILGTVLIFTKGTEQCKDVHDMKYCH